MTEQRRINPGNIEKVKELTHILTNAKSIVLVDYKGINVQEDTQLRKNFRSKNVQYLVVKNRLLKLAMANLNIKDLDKHLVGPTSVAISKQDEVIPAKIISEFIDKLGSDRKEQNILQLKAGMIAGTYADEQMLKEIVKLPSHNELIAMLVRNLNAPIYGFVMSLTGILRKFVGTIEAISKDKEGKSDSKDATQSS